jgi:hypothetical protein
MPDNPKSVTHTINISNKLKTSSDDELKMMVQFARICILYEDLLPRTCRHAARVVSAPTASSGRPAPDARTRRLLSFARHRVFVRRAAAWRSFSVTKLT